MTCPTILWPPEVKWHGRCRKLPAILPIVDVAEAMTTCADSLSLRQSDARRVHHASEYFLCHAPVQQALGILGRSTGCQVAVAIPLGAHVITFPERLKSSPSPPDRESGASAGVHPYHELVSALRICFRLCLPEVHRLSTRRLPALRHPQWLAASQSPRRCPCAPASCVLVQVPGFRRWSQRPFRLGDRYQCATREEENRADCVFRSGADKAVTRWVYNHERRRGQQLK